MVYISTDNGITWHASNNGLKSNTIYVISYFDNKIFLGTNSGLYFSSDSGKNWHEYDTLLKNSQIYRLFVFKNSLYLWDSNYPSYLYKANPENMSLEKVCDSPTYINCIVSKNDSLYCCGDDGIYLSLDSGKNWKSIRYVQGYSALTMIFFNDTIIAGYDSDFWEFSYDNGNTWIQKYPPASIISFIHLFNNNMIINTAYKGVFYSNDHYNTWTKLNDGLPDRTIYTMAFINNALYCSPEDCGIYKLDLSFLDVKDTPENTKHTIVCTNPVTDILTICNMPNDFNYNTNIEIYNIYGLKIIELPYTDKIDVSKFSAGVYYLKINNQFIKFIKFIKL